MRNFVFSQESLAKREFLVFKKGVRPKRGILIFFLRKVTPEQEILVFIWKVRPKPEI